MIFDKCFPALLLTSVILVNNNCQLNNANEFNLTRHSIDLTLNDERHVIEVCLDSAWNEVPAITWGLRASKKFIKNNNYIEVDIPAEVDSLDAEYILYSYSRYIYSLSDKTCSDVEKRALNNNSISGVMLYCISDSNAICFLVGLDKNYNIPVRFLYKGSQMSFHQFEAMIDDIRFKKG